MYLRYGDLSWEVAERTDTARSSNDESRTQSVRSPFDQRLPVVDINGIELHAVTEERCIQHILDELAAGRGGVVVTPNLDHLRRCVHDMRFGALVAEANLVLADGMPLVWASKLQGTPLPERVAGSDLISSLSAAAAERGRRIYLLGGSPGTAEAAAAVLRQRHPEIQIVGTFCPPFGFEKDPAMLETIERSLTESIADIVFVALGSPKQELLIERMRTVLPKAWWLGVGNSFSFLSGDVRRAPIWMQKHGLEWFHRLMQEPRRLFKRYIILGLPFAATLAARSSARGLARRWSRPKTAPAPPPVPAAVPQPKPVPPVNRVAELLVPDRAALARLRALVLLGGSVRPAPLTVETGRSILNLPLDERGSILDHWMNQARHLAHLTGIEMLPVRILVDPHSAEPTWDHGREEYRALRMERDQSEYRGTGGVLGDLAIDYADDDWIVVCNAAQILLEDLAALVEALWQTGGDVSVVSHADGTPSGVTLIRCAALRGISPAGFVDLKEQALPAIAEKYDVTVVNRRRPTGLPIRTLGDYVNGLRRHHRRRAGRPAFFDPLAEDWRSSFALVEEGAMVDPLARIHDSVVLRGGRVEQGAVVVRSIVCEKAVVRRDRTTVDGFVK